MTIRVVQLFVPSQVPATDTVYVTCGANVKQIIDKLVFVNTDASVAYTITVNLVKSGGSASASNLLVSAHSIAANDSWICSEAIGAVLLTGDFLSLKASSASKITAHGYGREVTL